MNVTTLNMTTLDGGVIIKKGGGVPINNQDKVVDITENGTTEVVADSEFTGLGKVTINTEVEGAKPKWTGHADAEGLRAIGWTDEDIAYYQQYGVNWNEEDDEWHKVSEDNKALYGVLTADNISTYKDRIVYLPKIDTSGLVNMSSLFMDCSALIAIPMLDASSATTIANTFRNCVSLVCVPALDVSNVRAAGNCFYNCYSLTHIADLDLSQAYNMQDFLYSCYSLVTFPKIKFFKNISYRAVSFLSICQNCYSLVGFPSTENIAPQDIITAFYNCKSLKSIGVIDMSFADYSEAVYQAFDYCGSLESVYLKNVGASISLKHSHLLSKDSLLYIINNEAATSAITIKLASYAYDKWATDADVVAALANHPNITLAK